MGKIKRKVGIAYGIPVVPFERIMAMPTLQVVVFIYVHPLTRLV